MTECSGHLVFVCLVCQISLSKSNKSAWGGFSPLISLPELDLKMHTWRSAC